MPLNCIAIDDEPLALGLVCAFIEKTPFLNLVGRYSSGVEALEAIQSQEINLIFLDIQMPDLTGIELARIIDKGPKIIFTTAFNQFALDGFKVDALDYLLKPFNYEEFLRAAQKAKTYFDLVEQARTTQPKNNIAVEETCLFLKVEYQLVRVPFDDVLYIEGLKDYVKVHLKSTKKPLLSLTSLKALEEKLPSHKFMRVHRSFIVSLDKINAVTKNSIQIETVTIPVSEQHKDEFAAFLSKWS
jgi:two-component system, LytTR family, response regulator LytT